MMVELAETSGNCFVRTCNGRKGQFVFGRVPKSWTENQS